MPSIEVVDALNGVIGSAGSASLQHQAHEKVLAGRGHDSLATVMSQRIAGGPLTLDRLLSWIIDLGRKLHFEIPPPPPHVRSDLVSGLESDRALQVAALGALRAVSSTGGAGGDSTTRTLLDQVITDEEDPAWLETEIKVPGKVGETLSAASRLTSSTATEVV